MTTTVHLGWPEGGEINSTFSILSQLLKLKKVSLGITTLYSRVPKYEIK